MSNYPYARPPATEAQEHDRTMIEAPQIVLPPPDFLGRPEYGYSSGDRRLPTLQSLQQSYEMSHGRFPSKSDFDGQRSQQRGETRSTVPRTNAQAVPIARLLADPPPEQDMRHPEPKPFVFTGQATQQISRPGPQFAMQHAGYPPAPYSTSQSPVSPQFPSFFHQDPRQEQASFPPQGLFVKPEHPSGYAHGYGGHPGSYGVPTSTRSQASGSGGSHRGYSNEPQSASSDASMANAFAPIDEPEQPQYQYNLVMRQQPRAARACGFGERDRRVIDPPPIIEVVAIDPTSGEPHLETDSYATLHCVLINADTGADESHIAAPRQDMPSAQRLMGAAVSSPWVGKDEKGVKGSFFVFADLSVRSPGRYKLWFRLLKVNPLDMSRRHKNFILATIESDPFEVFTAKEFPGMRASSALLRALRSQGLNVGVKKGSDIKGKGKADGDEYEDEEEDESDEDGEDVEEDEREKPSAKKGGKGKAPDSSPETGRGKGKGRAKRLKK